MKRRVFIGILSGALVLTAILGWLYRTSPFFNRSDDLLPDSLAKICSKDKINDLGRIYREQSGEKQEEVLMELVFEDKARTSSKRHFLSSKVSEDFRSGHTVMVDGWLLSITEARQCALISLQKETK